MPELYLVRHGQASLGKADYDQLSDLGVEQSVWLGRYFAERATQFDRVVIGGQKRHAQTLDAIRSGLNGSALICEDHVTHDGLSEYDFDALFSAYYATVPNIDIPSDGRKRMRIFKKALTAWARDELVGGDMESWAAFDQRVMDGLSTARDVNADVRRVLVVTSGGPISCIAQNVLGAKPEMAVELNLQTRNASFSQFHFNASSIKLSSFNNIPHLDHPDRSETITYG